MKGNGTNFPGGEPVGNRIDWLAGVYFKRLTESDQLLDVENDELAGFVESPLDSGYGSSDAALYGSLDASLTDRSSLTFGMRAERRLARYHDTADETDPFPQQDDTMFGGNLSWERRLFEHDSLYVTLARGFTTTFAGIAINHVPGFIVAQLVGAAAGALLCWVLFPSGEVTNNATSGPPTGNDFSRS